jgi:hypothetical protein
MSFLKQMCGSMLFSLMLVAVASAGEPGGGATKAYRAAVGGAAHEDADAPDPSAIKGREPIGSLPARHIAGETARFDAAKAGPSVPKNRDGAGSLPTAVGSGEGSVYGAGGEAQHPTLKAIESTGAVGVSKP